MIGLLLQAFLCFAQDNDERPKYYHQNLMMFDRRQYHFGFILGLNQSDFVIERNTDLFNKYGLEKLENIRLPGFNLGIVGAYRITPNIRIKMIPSLSFQDRMLKYTFIEPDGSTQIFEKVVEATFVELPIYLKLRTQRVGNAALYAIGGAKLIRDMSAKKIDNLVADRDLLVRINKVQFASEFGGGIDLFLPYFKFGIELKMIRGFGSVMIDDGTRFNDPIKGLFLKGYLLTFTFEG